MKSCLLLQVVLLWASASANEQEQEPEYMKTKEDTEYVGYDIRAAPAPDQSYCQLMCSNDAQCNKYTYWDERFHCQMKHVPHGVTPEVRPAEGADSGCAIPPEKMDDYQCYEHLFREMNFPGHDILVLRKKSPEECSATCTYYEDCQYFSFNIKTHLCYMKSYTMLPSPPEIRILTGAVAGYTLKDCHYEDRCNTECSDLIMEEMDFPGCEFASMLQPDADRCQLVCNDCTRCKTFTYTNETHPDKNMRFRCSLKSHDTAVPPEMVEKPHYFSGYSMRTVRGHKTCSDEVYQDMDFPGYDQKRVKVATYEDCRTVCSADTLCQYWVFMTTDYFNPEYHFSCFLKNMMALPSPPVIENHDDMVSGFSQKECIDDESSEEITQQA